MGGIDDLLDDVEEEKVQEVADELDIEDKEEMKQLNDRLTRMAEMYAQHDGRIEELEAKIDILDRLFHELLNHIELALEDGDSDMKQDENTEDDKWLTESEDEDNGGGLNW